MELEDRACTPSQHSSLSGSGHCKVHQKLQERTHTEDHADCSCLGAQPYACMRPVQILRSSPGIACMIVLPKLADPPYSSASSICSIWRDAMESPARVQIEILIDSCLAAKLKQGHRHEHQATLSL